MATPFAARGDHHRGDVRVVRIDEIQHAPPHDLAVGPAESAAERVVDAGPALVIPGVDDQAVVVDDDDEARDRLHQRLRDIALPLQLHLALLSIGDVDAAGDDARDPARRVRDRCASPLDHPALSRRVRELVLVERGREVRRRLVEARLHRVALRLVDEDVPEVLIPEIVLGRETARRERGPVLVQDPAVRRHDDEQARCRVRDRLEEEELRAEVGLESDVLERKARSGRDERDEVRLGVERWIVNEGRDLQPAALDSRHRAHLPRRQAARPRALARRPSVHGSRPSRRSRATGRGARRRARREAESRRRARRATLPLPSGRSGCGVRLRGTSEGTAANAIRKRIQTTV